MKWNFTQSYYLGVGDDKLSMRATTAGEFDLSSGSTELGKFKDEVLALSAAVVHLRTKGRYDEEFLDKVSHLAFWDRALVNATNTRVDS